MARNVLLNNIDHKDLKVDERYSAELGDNIGSTVTFVTEFLEIQKEYPILFRKAPDSGEFQAVVLLGLKQDENLYLTNDNGTNGWSGRYIPAVVARGPFSIGLQKQIDGGQEVVVPMVHVDLDHPKVSTVEGEAVFSRQGGNTPYLDGINDILNLIRDGVAFNRQMFNLFEKMELIEPLDIKVDLDNLDKLRLTGFFTVNAERLAALAADQLKELSDAGYLQAAYLVVASLSNVKRLVEMKNAKNKA